MRGVEVSISMMRHIIGFRVEPKWMVIEALSNILQKPTKSFIADAYFQFLKNRHNERFENWESMVQK